MTNDRILTRLVTTVKPYYDQNDTGYKLDDMMDVMEHALDICIHNKLNVDKSMVYAMVAYHMVAQHTSDSYVETTAKSAELFRVDSMKFDFINPDDVNTIATAIRELGTHEPDSPPTSVYGKILASATKHTTVAKAIFYVYDMLTYITTFDGYDDAYEETRDMALFTYYSPDGWEFATTYYTTPNYEQFKTELRRVLNDPNEFKSVFVEVTGLSAPDDYDIKDPKVFHQKMVEITELCDDDPDARHCDMDELMCTLLEELGYSDGIEVFRHTKKYYA